MSKHLPVNAGAPKKKQKPSPLERAQMRFNKLVQAIAEVEAQSKKEAELADQYFQLYQQKMLPLLRQYATEKLLLVRHLDAIFYQHRFGKVQKRRYLEWVVQTLAAVAGYLEEAGDWLLQRQQELYEVLPKRLKEQAREATENIHQTDAAPESEDTAEEFWTENVFADFGAHQSLRHSAEATAPVPDDVGPLYKELAKQIHPDLEQDEAAKARKHELMQQLTEARKHRDLYTMLRIRASLETGPTAINWSLEQLQRFNKLLQQRLDQLNLQHGQTLVERMMTQGMNAFAPDDAAKAIGREVRELKKTIRIVREERMQIKSREQLEQLLELMA